MAKKTMRKTARRTAKATRTRRPTIRRAAPDVHGVQVVTRIVITPTGPNHPDPVTTFRKGPVAWLVHNVSGATCTVAIDPASFLDKKTMKPDNPLTTSTTLSVQVADKGKDSLLALIRDHADEIAYVYDVAVLNALDLRTTHVDPDLDVIDPQPIVRGRNRASRR